MPHAAGAPAARDRRVGEAASRSRQGGILCIKIANEACAVHCENPKLDVDRHRGRRRGGTGLAGAAPQMMTKLASLSLSLAIQLSLSLATHASAPPIAKLDGGTLEGIRANNVSQFLGVPFAQSPHGARRWMPPAPYPPWHTTLDATQYKPACSQGGGGPSSSEDCLFLDIYSPVDLDDPGAAKLAVVVFVHGGGFRSGQSSGWPTGVPLAEGGGTFNGTFMAKAQQVVVVSINCRLGVFGFLGSKELSAR
eukprot:COSAG06_NODE_14148_length_1184_cov_1.280184_1_plen_250_part_10